MKLFRFGPKVSVSPTLGDPCCLCHRPLVAGDYTTLVRHDPEGRVTRVGTEVHWGCAVRLHERLDAAPPSRRPSGR